MPMNTITSTNGQSLAMDGQNYFKAVSSKKVPVNMSSAGINGIAPTGAEVAQNIVQNLADVKEAAVQLQKLSDMVMGPKLQFRVNQELGSIVINVVDPNTDKVIKEIPSEDIQRLKVRMKKAIGMLFNELI
jgi:flagellar protein FlaG